MRTLSGLDGRTFEIEREFEHPGRNKALVVTQGDKKYFAKSIAEDSREGHMLPRMPDHLVVKPTGTAMDDSGAAYLLFPFYEGARALPARIYGGCLDSARRSFILTLAEAVEALEKTRLLHLDINPENILEVEEGDARLIDFEGALDRDTAGFEEIHFRKDYSAPELVIGRRIGSSVDIYSAGLVTLATLSGKSPRAPEYNRIKKQDPHRYPRFAEDLSAQTERLEDLGFYTKERLVAELPARFIQFSDLLSRTLSLNPSERPRATVFRQEVQRLI